MNLYLDIETIPSQDPALFAKFRAEVAPPASYKKQESIDEWMRENADRVAQDQVDKTGLDPAHGHICTIAWAWNEGGVKVQHAETVDDEAALLQALFDDMPSELWEKPRLVGHYISGFDIRFILCRAVVLGVRIPVVFPRDPKPWSDSVFDTMTAWAGPRDRISMDNLCAALGLEGKGDGLDGSQVAQAWRDGRHDEIAAYCARDVERSRAIHRKFIAAGF